MLEVFFSSHSISKEIQSQRIYNEQDNMSDRYIVYEKQPASNYQTQGQWIPRCYSTMMFWCTAPPSFSKNWWNTALVCYHTHHILKTWPHATLLFAWQENTVWWPLWQCTECQGCFNKGRLLERRSIPELLPRPLHLLSEMH
jgi:hypothetical protein